MVKITNLKVAKTEDGYFYALVGSEDHGRPSFRLWINRLLKEKFQEDEDFFGNKIDILPSPVQDAKVFITEKGNKVLKPEKGWTTILVFVPSGYRGESEIELNDVEAEVVVLPFYRYASERGSLGISKGLLISAPSEAFPLKLSWKRTGRTYGEPREGVSLVTCDGKILEQPPKDVEELLK